MTDLYPTPDDYPPVSPIGPSVVGGAQIAEVIARVATGHDFAARRAGVYM